MCGRERARWTAAPNTGGANPSICTGTGAQRPTVCYRRLMAMSSTDHLHEREDADDAWPSTKRRRDVDCLRGEGARASHLATSRSAAAEVAAAASLTPDRHGVVVVALEPRKPTSGFERLPDAVLSSIMDYCYFVFGLTRHRVATVAEPPIGLNRAWLYTMLVRRPRTIAIDVTYSPLYHPFLRLDAQDGSDIDDDDVSSNDHDAADYDSGDDTSTDDGTDDGEDNNDNDDANDSGDDSGGDSHNGRGDNPLSEKTDERLSEKKDGVGANGEAKRSETDARKAVRLSLLARKAQKEATHARRRAAREAALAVHAAAHDAEGGIMTDRGKAKRFPTRRTVVQSVFWWRDPPRALTRHSLTAQGVWNRILANALPRPPPAAPPPPHGGPALPLPRVSSGGLPPPRLPSAPLHYMLQPGSRPGSILYDRGLVVYRSPMSPEAALREAEAVITSATRADEAASLRTLTLRLSPEQMWTFARFVEFVTLNGGRAGSEDAVRYLAHLRRVVVSQRLHAVRDHDYLRWAWSAFLPNLAGYCALTPRLHLVDAGTWDVSKLQRYVDEVARARHRTSLPPLTLVAASIDPLSRPCRPSATVYTVSSCPTCRMATYNGMAECGVGFFCAYRDQCYHCNYTRVPRLHHAGECERVYRTLMLPLV